MQPVYLSLKQLASACAAVVRGGRVPLIFGAPGLGKTALARALAGPIGRIVAPREHYPALVCTLSHRDSVDIGGYPVVRGDTVVPTLYGTLADAARKPGLLVLDEFTTCSMAVQGPALRLVLERYAGEQPLHELTRIVCIANPPEMAPGGMQLTAATTNRVVVLHCRPTVAEFTSYLRGEPEARFDEPIDLPDETTWRARRSDLASIVVAPLIDARPDLLCFDPSAAAVYEAEQFSSPRAWDALLDVLAARSAAEIAEPTDITRALVLGAIGFGAGMAYLGMARARHLLPSTQEILAHPDTAQLPDEHATIATATGPQPVGVDVIFAAIPLVLEAARTDTYAAWVYLGRLPKEVQHACAMSMLATVSPDNKPSPWCKQGTDELLRVCEAMDAGHEAPGPRIVEIAAVLDGGVDDGASAADVAAGVESAQTAGFGEAP